MFTVVKFCRHRAAAGRRVGKVREGPHCIKPLLLTSTPDFRRARWPLTHKTLLTAVDLEPFYILQRPKNMKILRF